jgi:hypothetical protein
MRRSGTAVILLGLVSFVLTGCGPHSLIPPGGQQVHVTVAASEVRVSPTSVRAGDVYLVMDTPGAFVLVSRKATADATPGALRQDDVGRLAQGDTEGTSIEAFASGCSPAQCSKDRPWMGYGGNTFKVVLSAGMYAFLLSDPAGTALGLVPPKSMVVLQVLP